MRPLKRTVVLTSRENFVWLSMQEIIPLIEKNWRDAAVRGHHEVVIRNVDSRSIPELMPELLRADQIVFTCFTVKLARIGELLRKSLSLEARYFIYLHQQATILCWPLHAWGMGTFLRENDVFVASSTADARAMAHSFARCRVVVIPFTTPGIRESYRVPAQAREIPFVYAGRISAQKNLHTLLYAFRIFHDARPELKWKLRIFGKEDHLGSPNMGMRSSDYGKTLRRLVRTLELEDHVVFEGHRDRGSLNRFLSRQKYVAVSASLHSDENFGMVPFRALCAGNLVVLTRWGGYVDFKRSFSDRVFLANVHETELGPWVDPFGFATLLARAADEYRRQRSPNVAVPGCYGEDRIAARLLKLAMEKSGARSSVRLTALAKRILKKREVFKASVSNPTQIFESYSDPDARIPFRSYGMVRGKRPRSLDAKQHCAPWVSLKPGSVLVRDPHRGSFELECPRLPDNARAGVVLTDWYGRGARVSSKTASKLSELGYSHP